MDRAHYLRLSCVLGVLLLLGAGCGRAKKGEPLLVAVADGKLATVKALLDKGVDPNMKGAVAGDTGLHLAAFVRSVPIATLLLEAGADPNVPRDDGATPLHIAAMLGQTELVKLLLEHGADVNVQNGDGMTPLALATANEKSEVAELLEAHEARARWGIRAPARLSDVSGAGSVAEAETLLDEETGPDVTGPTGLTPLAAAALGYQPETAKLLIEHGADVNMTSAGATPLHFAAMAASVEVAKVLLAHGADVNALDGHGVTPLSLAEESGVSEMVNLLEEHGGEVGWGDEPWTPMFEAVGRRDAAAAEALLAGGADPSEKGIRWVTPLHLAVTIQSPEMVRLLLGHGANPNAATTRGLPRSQARPDSIANHAASKPGATPLHIAVCEGNAELVGLLLDGGADVNQENGVGETPLATALTRGHEDIIRLLKEKGGLEHAPLPKPEPESGPPRI